MKRYTFPFISVLFLIAATLSGASQKAVNTFTVMSYNIRNSLEKDGTNAWDYRYPASGMMIDDNQPDVVCVQEALKGQVSYLDVVLEDYKAVGVGADNGKNEGEFTAILYKKKTVSVSKWGTFWLSDTPEKASDGWDGEKRLCATWAVMKDKKSGKRFFIVNVRLAGERTLRDGAALVAAKVRELNKDGLPAFVAGDFNMEYSDSSLLPLRSVMSNAREDAAIADTTPSFNGWGKSQATIDHIWYSGVGSCISFETVTKPYYERNFISDHYPVKATFIF